jgi:hypothetical protein
MTLVRTNEEDAPTPKRVHNDIVQKRYGERCGADCAKVWNQTAGTAVGLAIPE